MSSLCDKKSFVEHLLRDILEPLESCRTRSPSTTVPASVLADLERADSFAVVAELVFRRLCWC